MELWLIIGVAITAVTTVIGVVWKLSGWKHKLDGELDKMDGKLDKVNGKLDDLEPLRKNAGLFASMLEEMHKSFIEKFGRPIAESNSPISLNDYGKELSRKIEAKKLADAYANRIHETEEKDMNAYQIQERCFSFCKNELMDDLRQTNPQHFEKISDIAFNDGIDTKKLMRVVGIELRDRILSMRGISHTEVDEHSPD